MGSVGGNIMTASPISDLNPIYVSSGTIFHLESLEGGKRSVKAEEFFLSYRTVDAKPAEILTSVEIPLNRENELSFAFKQSRRYVACNNEIIVITSQLLLPPLLGGKMILP